MRAGVDYRFCSRQIEKIAKSPGPRSETFLCPWNSGGAWWNSVAIRPPCLRDSRTERLPRPGVVAQSWDGATASVQLIHQSELEVRCVMKKVLLASVGLIALGIASASAADIQRRGDAGQSAGVCNAGL